MAARPPRKFPRMLRVNELVRQTLADEMEHLSDPRLELVTITGVDVSPDLRNATVWFAKLGTHDPATGEALAAAAPHLRATLGRQVRLKYLPRLQFREDPAIETGQRVEEILRGLHQERGDAGAEG
jgi:ribosome-binding factor A